MGTAQALFSALDGSGARLPLLVSPFRHPVGLRDFSVCLGIGLHERRQFPPQFLGAAQQFLHFLFDVPVLFFAHGEVAHHAVQRSSERTHQGGYTAPAWRRSLAGQRVKVLPHGLVEIHASSAFLAGQVFNLCRC